MTAIWPAIWSSPVRAAAFGAVLSAVIASILYAFNWHTFYDTRTLEARQRAERIAEDIRIIVDATRDSDKQRIQAALQEFLENQNERVAVTKGAEDSPEWSLSNDVPVDASRTQLDERFEFDTESGGALSVSVREGIRPALWTALLRAWTFSVGDYFRSPKDWWSRALYNRSVPLYGYLLTVVIIGFGTIRAVYRDQQELKRLEAEGRRITEELDALRQTHVQELKALEEQMSSIRSQREEASRERDRLLKEIGGIDEEYQELVGSAPTAPDGSTVEARLRDNAVRRSEARMALASYNERVARFESELARAQEEMRAAEHLVHEVDDKREDLEAKLRDRNREIRKLQNLVQQAQKETHALQLDNARQPAHSADGSVWRSSHDSIEAQLSQWVRSGGHAKISFSSHSRVVEVEQQLERIDRAFLDRYFTHVVNPEYERGARRLIRVNALNPDDADGSQGELIVALDDDAGRTLGFRFGTRADAPDPTQVGFALAMLMRTYCRDFRNFAIRTR